MLLQNDRNCGLANFVIVIYLILPQHLTVVKQSTMQLFFGGYLAPSLYSFLSATGIDITGAD